MRVVKRYIAKVERTLHTIDTVHVLAESEEEAYKNIRDFCAMVYNSSDVTAFKFEEIKEDDSNDENLDKDNQNQDPTETDINNSNEESIEAIPFIAKPTKDKRTKSTK